MAVTLGIWLRHDKGFSYNNAKAVREQAENAKKMVMRFKDDPAVLMWAVPRRMAKRMVK